MYSLSPLPLPQGLLAKKECPPRASRYRAANFAPNRLYKCPYILDSVTLRCGTLCASIYRVRNPTIPTCLPICHSTDSHLPSHLSPNLFSHFSSRPIYPPAYSPTLFSHLFFHLSSHLFSPYLLTCSRMLPSQDFTWNPLLKGMNNRGRMLKLVDYYLREEG